MWSFSSGQPPPKSNQSARRPPLEQGQQGGEQREDLDQTTGVPQQRSETSNDAQQQHQQGGYRAPPLFLARDSFADSLSSIVSGDMAASSNAEVLALRRAMESSTASRSSMTSPDSFSHFFPPRQTYSHHDRLPYPAPPQPSTSSHQQHQQERPLQYSSSSAVPPIDHSIQRTSSYSALPHRPVQSHPDMFYHSMMPPTPSSVNSSASSEDTILASSYGASVRRQQSGPRSSASSDDPAASVNALTHSFGSFSSVGQYQGELPTSGISPRHGDNNPESPTKASTSKKSYKRLMSNQSLESMGSASVESDSRSSGQQAIVGESRLKINFISLGSVGVYPQRFGKSSQFIPHGLIGTHEMYEQTWQFETWHGDMIDETTAIITYRITNVASGLAKTVSETPRQAKYRSATGRTMCNAVVRDTLSERHRELQQQLLTLGDNPTKAANVRSLMAVISPRRCTVGLLFFGLLHMTVQDNIRAEMDARGFVIHPTPGEGASEDEDDE